MTKIVVSAVPPAPRPGLPVRSVSQSRPRLSADLIAWLAARSTPRDLWLLRMLAEHRVLTSLQVAQLAFTSPSTPNPGRALPLETRCLRDCEQERPKPLATHAGPRAAAGDSLARHVHRRTRCLSTPPTGTPCSAASPTAMTSPPRTPT